MITCAPWLALALLAATPASPASSAPPSQPTPPSPTEQPSPTTAPAAQPSPSAPAPSGAVEERLLRAEKLYKERRYVDSARELEALWDETRQLNALYNAALARFAAGHFAQTISYLRTYTAQVKDAPPEALEVANFQLDKAKERSVEVPLIVGPPAALSEGAEVTIRRIPDNPGDRRPDLFVRLTPAGESAPAATNLYLDAGRWSVAVSARGYMRADREINVVKGKVGASPVSFVLARDMSMRAVALRVELPAGERVEAVPIRLIPSAGGEAQACTIRPFERNECKLLAATGAWELRAELPGYLPFTQQINLTSGESAAAFTVAMVIDAPPPPVVDEPPPPGPVEVVPKPARLRLAGGLNASGLPLFVTGLALAVAGSNRYDRVANAEPDACDSASEAFGCRGDAIKAIRMRTAGLALVGTATGLFVTGLTGEFDVKPRVWYAEMGAGGALLIGGAAWLGATNVALNKELRVGEGQAPPVWVDSVPNIDRATNQRLAASMILGTGLGLVAGSTVGLLVRRHHQRKGKASAGLRSVGPYTNVGQLGLMLEGRF
jgi:hypothetical protein